MNDIIIHLHMPKTGGTTLKNIIKKNVPSHLNFDIYEDHHERAEKLKAIANQPTACIQGHFPYGVHEFFTTPCVYITMLREPAERIISEYYFICTNKKHRLHHQVKNMTLEQYQSQPNHMNIQTRFLSGQLGSPLTEKDLQQARKNITSHFSVVGLTEQFNESLFLMKQRFGWAQTQYTKLNKTKKKTPIHKIRKKTIDMIYANNSLDQQLYSFAKQRLQQQLHQFHHTKR
ncbi:sulfotransferase family 2 domain-containing protein [Alkalihalobacterium bogoriense]|uniref:sulfotransferase family 2 domain-containing protein n=1 Tax=Alkalihalobacterium bogoriense TaxID=246272 RepID=UPI000478687B|nr:sulfotransferase family 2 domain-containing protein [Alkalihalobacterium bogoriense]